jgi:hypothetical protein
MVRVLHDPWLHKRGAQGRIGRFLPPMGVWMCQRLLELYIQSGIREIHSFGLGLSRYA